MYYWSSFFFFTKPKSPARPVAKASTPYRGLVLASPVFGNCDVPTFGVTVIVPVDGVGVPGVFPPGVLPPGVLPPGFFGVNVQVPTNFSTASSTTLLVSS